MPFRCLAGPRIKYGDRRNAKGVVGCYPHGRQRLYRKRVSIEYVLPAVEGYVDIKTIMVIAASRRLDC